MHELMGIQSILIAGTNEQKEKYISKLASGEYISAFCLTELDSGYDPASVSILAEFYEDRKKLVLNGKKVWVTNGNIADIFIVVAKIPSPEKHSESIGLIIVEKNSEGITLGTPEKSLGLTGCNICSVEFKETIVPAENIIKSDDGSIEHLLKIFSYGMFGIGASTTGFLKELFDKTVNYAIHKDILQKPMIENELIQEKMGEIACKIYAIESMVYLTAGILDMVEEPDCKIENAILKVFGAEQTWWCVNKCIEILGSRSYFKNYPYSRYLRDSLAWNIVEGSSDMLKMYISLTGFNYAGSHISENVKKLRNPLFNPVFIFKKLIEKNKIERNKANLSMDIAGHLHPSLKSMANNLEQNVIKLQHAVEILFATYGQILIELMKITKKLHLNYLLIKVIL
ncbi:acyl-CoA dehydrogenase family member 9, mitochondrial-like isoform X1 [Centruroides sculpturatus]|uniref:acyl-CoA dehydrogenase family member 9, mitochondrial-like isoform X1 n=1 Tax=Centruroides sculpturatus TaxID=218467 RepID=UPI000C6E8CD8|nr:acyl-CoA dehydrogenase family member 9, mitochondrial-like isoform X1 [Centruroides sculpturatus]